MGKNGSFDYAYNAQISVDADLQIIVAQHVSQNANDKQEIEPALLALQASTDQLPEILSADNGYWSGGTLQVLEQSGIDAYLATDKGEARTINTDNKEPLRQQMNVKMEQQASKDIYSKRKVIVEPVLGQIKNSGFRGFSVRGKEKVAGEFSMVCAAHNFKKIAKAIITGLIRPELGNFTANPAI